MATYTKFEQTVEDIAHKVHDFSSDLFTLALTNSSNPPLVTNSVLADLTEISYTNLGSRNFVLNTSGQAGGVYTLSQNDLVIAATGAVATFRFGVLYNNTAAGDPLVAFWDGGKDFTLANGESFTFDFATNITFTLT